jgi:hypothetical protein
MCKATRYDSSSEPPGFLLGTSWTVHRGDKDGENPGDKDGEKKLREKARIKQFV